MSSGAQKHAEGGNEHKAAGHMLKVLTFRAAKKAHLKVAEGTYSSVAELEDGRRAEELRANLELRKVQVQLRIQHLESWAEWHCKQITEIYTAHNGSGARPAPDDEQRSALNRMDAHERAEEGLAAHIAALESVRKNEDFESLEAFDAAVRRADELVANASLGLWAPGTPPPPDPPPAPPEPEVDEVLMDEALVDGQTAREEDARDLADAEDIVAASEAQALQQAERESDGEGLRREGRRRGRAPAGALRLAQATKQGKRARRATPTAPSTLVGSDVEYEGSTSEGGEEHEDDGFVYDAEPGSQNRRRCAGGKARRTGAKLVLSAGSKSGAGLLPLMAQRQNSLARKALYRKSVGVTAEMPVGMADVTTMPDRAQYTCESCPPTGGCSHCQEQWTHDHAEWQRRCVHQQPVQQRWAAKQEKQVGLINDWLTQQGHPPFVRWVEGSCDGLADGESSDSGADSCGQQLRLVLDGAGNPLLPTTEMFSSWAYAYATGQAKKGGRREYRAGPWYGRMLGKTQDKQLMPEAKEREFGHGAFASEPPRFTTIEQSLCAARQWLKHALRDFPKVANPLETQAIREATANLEAQLGRAPVETRLPRALSKEELRALISSARVTPESAGSLARAIEEVTALLYATKNSVHGTRAHDEHLLNFGDVVPVAAAGDGCKSGCSFQHVASKGNKKQVTDKKLLQCTSVCPGSLVILEDGTPDPGKFCAAHLVEHLRGLVAEFLGVAPADLPADLPLYLDVSKISKLLAGSTLVAADDESSAVDAGLCVCVVTAEEEALGYMYDRTQPFIYNDKEYLPPVRGVWFEVAGTGCAVKAWATAGSVSKRLRRQLLRASKRTDTRIDAIEKVSSKTMRRTMATIMSQEVSMPELCAIGDWSSEAMAKRCALGGPRML